MLAEDNESVRVFIPGDVICGPESKLLRGYNCFYSPAAGASVPTSPETSNIVSAVAGAVEVVERVVSMRAMATRYVPEVGDVVVGRIIDVAGNRWRCDVGGHLTAVMMLSNVTEPGGILRRRGREDELSMRSLFTDGDVFAAEVQRVTPDGLISLHTRSAQKYGKMTAGGTLVSINPSLVKRLKQHFHLFRRYCVSAVIGVNGGIWVSAATPEEMVAAEEEEAGKSSSESESLDGDLGVEREEQGSLCKVDISDGASVRRAVARVCNCITVIANSSLLVSPGTISAAVDVSFSAGWAPFDVLLPANREELVLAVRQHLGYAAAAAAVVCGRRGRMWLKNSSSANNDSRKRVREEDTPTEE